MCRSLLLTCLIVVAPRTSAFPSTDPAPDSATAESAQDTFEWADIPAPQIDPEPAPEPAAGPAGEPVQELVPEPATTPPDEPGIELIIAPAEPEAANAPPSPIQPEVDRPDDPEIIAPPVPAITPQDLALVARESIGPVVETLSARLASIERMLADQSHVSMETQQKSTQTLLLVSGTLAVAIFLGGLFAALILARALRRVSELVIGALPPNRQLPAGTTLIESHPDLPDPEAPTAAVAQRFLGAMERLEHRIAELEQSASNGAPDASPNPPPSRAAEPRPGNGGAYEFSVSALNRKQYGQPDSPAGAASDPAALWLGKGQALVNLGMASDALDCFEKAAALNPACAADAYVRRGMAYESLQQMEAAIECYDHALAANPALTLAYLYKGAVCNRLQRYREALDCYDNALRCERRSVAD
jgi:hypothetical protein